MNSVLRRFWRYIPSQALIVYRLIDAALVRIFFMVPSYLKFEILAKSGPRFAAKGLLGKILEV